MCACAPNIEAGSTSSERACRRCTGRGCLGTLSHKCLSDRGNNNNFSDRPTDRLESSPGGWSSPEPPQEATTTTFPTDRLSYLSYRLALDCIPAPCLQGHVNKPGIAHRARVRERMAFLDPGVMFGRGCTGVAQRRRQAPRICVCADVGRYPKK